MTEKTSTQILLALRTEKQKDAFDRMGVDDVMSFASKEIEFSDVVMGIDRINHDALRQFYVDTYAAFSEMKVVSSEATGDSPFFNTWQMIVEGMVIKDIPALGVRAGETVSIAGVSLLWWEYGDGSEWDGDVSEERVSQWKIRRQADYFLPLPKDA